MVAHKRVVKYYSLFIINVYRSKILASWPTEVEFVPAITAGGSVKFLPVV